MSVRYEVAIAVRVVQSDRTAHGTSIKRTYTFGDNPRWLAGGAGEAIRMTGEELAEAMERGEQPLDEVSGRPVVLP